MKATESNELPEMPHLQTTEPHRHAQAVYALTRVDMIGQNAVELLYNGQDVAGLFRIAAHEARIALESGAMVAPVPDGVAICCCAGGWIAGVKAQFGTPVALKTLEYAATVLFPEVVKRIGPPPVEVLEEVLAKITGSNVDAALQDLLSRVQMKES